MNGLKITMTSKAGKINKENQFICSNQMEKTEMRRNFI